MENESNIIRQKAYAKLNLGLDVIGKRADGYHLVDMIMQTVGIFDTLEIRRMEDAPAEQVRLRIVRGGQKNIRDAVNPREYSDGSLQGPYTMNPHEAFAGELEEDTLTAGEDNLVVRAIRRMQQEYWISCGFEAVLIKRIPVAAGMAGGSADAAAALRGVRDLCVPEVTDRELEEIGVSLGADVPYCVTGGTKRCEGIGELLTDLPPAPECGIVILKPPIGVSTPWVYHALDAAPIARHPDIRSMIRADEAGNLREMMRPENAWNVLEPVTAAAHPEIGQMEQFLTDAAAQAGVPDGLVRVMMTGSGPTCFALFDTEEQAEKVWGIVRSHPVYGGYEHACTEFVGCAGQ